MGSSVPGVLTVDEGVYVFPVGIAVGKDYFYVLTLQMYRWVERSLAEIFCDEVQQTVFGLVGTAVQNYSESLFEIGVVLHHGFHIVQVEGVLAEHLLVREEFDQGAVLLLGGFLLLFHEFALAEQGPMAEPVPVGAHVEFFREGIHRLGTHTVEAYGLLECLVVEFASGVEYAHCLHNRAERNPSAEVTHAHMAVFADVDLNLLAEAHRVFVYSVVHDFLQKHIDAIVLTPSVSESSDVHSRPHPDVGHAFQSPDIVLCIINLFALHKGANLQNYRVNIKIYDAVLRVICVQGDHAEVLAVRFHRCSQHLEMQLERRARRDQRAV